MATAKRSIPAPSPVEIVLTLTEAEAKVLRFVVDSIAGPYEGPRGLTDNIAEALASAGIKANDYLPVVDRRDSIEFI